MTLVYIAIGSNLNSPLKQVNTAITALKVLSHSLVVSISSYYRTIPLGPKNQPDYLNVVIALKTNLTPEILLNSIQLIELQQGRIRSKEERWGPRSIDLDIMLFGNKIIRTDRLIIPHYDMKNRSFMLWPLFEIATELKFPDGDILKEAISRLGIKKPPYW